MPLPPCLPTNCFNTGRTELPLEMCCRSGDVVDWYGYVFYSNPMWRGYPLCCKSLYIFDSVVGSEDEKLPDEIETDVVTDMRGGLFVQGSSIEILQNDVSRKSDVSETADGRGRTKFR